LIPSYKGIYKGAGLGLAITKQFIDDIKGEIYCESELGKGSVFTFLFALQESLLDDDKNVIGTEDLIYEHEKTFFPSVRIKQKIVSPKGMSHVLLVEDQPLAARVAQSIIAGLDCSVDVAEDGATALKLMAENDYDLIFMDVGLPDISGTDLTKQIRVSEWKLDQHIPIISLTAHIDSENKQSCIESGMDAVLSKPLSSHTAKDILNAFIPTRKSGEEAKASDTKEALLTLTGKSIDIEESIKKSNGNVQAAKEMLALLVEGFKEDLPILATAKAKNDWETIRKIVHKQRGGACYCGTPRFTQISMRLEECVSSQKTELYEALYRQLLEEMGAISREEALL